MTEDTVFRELPCQTRVEWDIKKFLDLPQNGDYYLNSPSFSLSHVKWYLCIYPNASKLTKSTDFISMSITRRFVLTDCSISFSIGIIRADSSELKLFESEHTFIMGESECIFDYTERSELIRSKDELLPDGCLTIFCTARIVDKTNSDTQLPSPNGTGLLAEQLKNLYLNKRHTDVTVLVKNQEFFAHKSILAARSTVFASMFDHDMAEKSSGTIEISDCDPDSFEQFLLFLYTGVFDNVSPSNTASLYETADKYDVKELMVKCVNCLQRELTVDSFCSVVHLAAMHNECNLMEAATKFFVSNVETILLTTKWQSFIVENPLMGNELFYKAIKSKKLKEK